MARLQDFPSVTPTSSDKILIVQSQGQGLAPHTIKMDSANPTGSGALSLNRKANTTVGTNSVAVGIATTASGSGSFAEGNSTVASGIRAHAEGEVTTASGYTAHAEGTGTTASGNYSHAEGENTIANHRAQHVFGQNNVADGNESANVRGNYVEIVGNGTSDSARSNARTLDWNGNEVLAGDLTIKGNMSVENAIGGIKRYELNTTHPIVIPTGSYSAFLILGFAQGVGVVNVLLKNNNNTIAAYDFLSGNAFSSTYLTFTLSNGQLTIGSSQASYSYLTVIGGGLNVSL